jgi:transposase
VPAPGPVLSPSLLSYQQAMQLLDTLPGVNQRVAQIIIAEVGVEMDRFPSAAHLASWGGLCPGNHQSAGKHLRGTTRKGDRWLRQALIEAAQRAMRTKAT